MVVAASSRVVVAGVAFAVAVIVAADNAGLAVCNNIEVDITVYC